MNSQASSANQPRCYNARRVAVVVFVVIIIVAGVLVAWTILGRGPLPTPIVVNRILLNGTITVNADSFWYLQFIIPPNAGQIQVSGSFTASGGGGNEVSVYIMNETSFKHWIPRNQGEINVNTNYNSGQLATGNITATLSSGGIYYLVYNNNFFTSQKDVNTQVNLSYFYIPTG